MWIESGMFAAKIERRNALIVLLIVALISTGCVRRRMTIRTNPPGAMVYVDRQPIGRTPVSHSFTYYGTRHFEIVHDGYRTEKFLRTFYPPWYQVPPLDFVFENLWPFEKRDDRIIDVQMVPDEPIALETLVQNGEQLRLQASQGIAVPGVGTVGATSSFNSVMPPVFNSPWNAPFEGAPPSAPSAPPIQDWPPNSALEEVLTPRDTFPQSVPSVTPGGSFRPPISGG